MNLPENAPPAARRINRAWILFLAALSTAPAWGEPDAAPPDSEIRLVSSDAEPCLSVRRRPSRRGAIIDCLNPGSRVTVTGTRGIWSRVTAEGDVYGWVTSGFLVGAKKEAPRARQEPVAGAVEKAPVRILVESDPVTAPAVAEAAAQADSERRQLAERARIAEQLASELEAERDRLAEQARVAEARAADLEEERGQLAERARIAEARAADLEEERGQLAERVRAAQGPASELEIERDRLAERARVAEARVADLEAELSQLAERARVAEQRAADLEADMEAGGEAAGDPPAGEGAEAGAASIEELARERDELDRELKREHARMLYLRSDLERTRAELMRLKGVPEQLVQPEPEPETPAARPEPPPETAADAAEPAAPATPATPPFVLMDEVVDTIRAWAQAWADQRAEDYLSFYSPSFTPPDNQSREAWASGRRERIRAPRSIVITLDRINPMVSGDRASVTFEQSYSSETFSDKVTKTLVLERTPGGSWQILEERVD